MIIATRAKIGVGEVRLSEKAKRYVNAALDGNRLSYGHYAQKFESEFARIHGRQFACYMNSGTSALQVGLAAMKEHYGWKDGSEVLVPALTFVASYNVIVQNNLTPVLVDVRMSDYGMDPNLVVPNKNVVAIMPVHLFGRPSTSTLRSIAALDNIRVIADSCETMFMDGCAEGDVSCFSTYACHLINTGVGGFATTNDPDLAMLIRSYANHGRNGIYTGIDDQLGSRETMDARFQFDRMGYSYRATELEAAIGCAELEDYQENVLKRVTNASAIINELADLPLVLPSIAGSVHMMLPIVCQDDVRDELTRHLESYGIETRPMLPLTNQPYMKALGVNEDDFPVAKRINRNGFYVGSHPYLTEEDIERMSDAFHSFFNGR